ncbi:CLUMA_CG001138, isoform A [Clunio marinus]|uniref:CLUMA_CG001138, isoform A n=1 Tax=Clunio marinus TaxID=568069 RepID=A0A1J1HH36_9DIPT|nr:CLUMA_CG001138, isoform A [Clunio marinus]
MLSISRTLRYSTGIQKNGYAMALRMLSMYNINDDLYLCTDKPRNIEIDKKSLRFKQKRENTKPLVLMISWFYGQKHQINKYSQIYTDQGMDVLVGRISLVQFLFNIKSVERSGQNIVNVLHNNEHDYKEIFIHTFSAGGGMYGLCQKMMKKNLPKYGNIPNRVIGQIWDSVAAPRMTIVAIPFALYPNNTFMRSIVTALLWCHLKIYRALQPHYNELWENFCDNLAKTPTLIFASKIDPIGTIKCAEEVIGRWRANGVDVTYKCFEDSPHIKHMQKYPEEYMKYVHDHWKKLLNLRHSLLHTMGNHSSSHKKKSSASSSPTKTQTDSISPTKSQGMIRSPSGADFQDKTHTKFAPIDELAKLLAKKNESEGSGSGITDQIFTKYVFPNHPDLGMRLFRHFHTLSHAKTPHLGVTAFRQQCERFLSILDDSKVIETYVRIFCDVFYEENATKEGVKNLLKLSFNIAMANYLGEAHTCPYLDTTLDAVIGTCFFQEPLSVGFISRWLEENCPRIVIPVHRYSIHLLTTIKKDDDDSQSTSATSPSSVLPSQVLLSKLVAAVPSHWTLLYDTRLHGVGANRFLHHVLGYRGPTLVVISCRSTKDNSDKIYCVAAPNEWKETHLYTGGEDSCLVQLSPKFSVMEKGQKILYLNTHIRGYPKGFRVAVDPRNPIISVNEDFERVDIHSITHNLLNIEVWGCGDKTSRDVQLDIKKWQIKEAERQRTVKLTSAEWIENPDRYLLELGGRTQYNVDNK